MLTRRVVTAFPGIKPTGASLKTLIVPNLSNGIDLGKETDMSLEASLSEADQPSNAKRTSDRTLSGRTLSGRTLNIFAGASPIRSRPGRVGGAPPRT